MMETAFYPHPSRSVEQNQRAGILGIRSLMETNGLKLADVRAGLLGLAAEELARAQATYDEISREGGE